MKNTLYPEIVSQMIKNNENLQDIANLLSLKNISQVSRRLDGKVDWSISEAEILCKHYNIDFWELFKRKED